MRAAVLARVAAVAMAAAPVHAQAPAAGSAPPVAPAAAAAQAPETPTAQPAADAGDAPADQPAGTTEVPPTGENYTYQPDGRRDPFLNLLGTGNEARPGGTRGDGASGLSVAEITVRGVLESRGSMIAMIQGPDRKTYLVREGDRFLDGTIRTVMAEGLVVVQEVNDPLSLVKQREIRKLLRSLESAKE